MAILNRRPGLGPKRARSLLAIAKFLRQSKIEPSTIDVCRRAGIKRGDMQSGHEYIEQLLEWQSEREEKRSEGNQ